MWRTLIRAQLLIVASATHFVRVNRRISQCLDGWMIIIINIISSKHIITIVIIPIIKLGQFLRRDGTKS